MSSGSPRFTQIADSAKCCRNERGGVTHGMMSSLLREQRVRNASNCEALCRSSRDCHFFSISARNWCIPCTECELVAGATPRDQRWTSWARTSGSPSNNESVDIDAAQMLSRVLASLDLNGSYSVQLYGARGRMPPQSSLRLIWLSLLPNTSLLAIRNAMPPCSLAARPPLRMWYTARDLRFASTQDALWLHTFRSGATMDEVGAPNHSWVEVTHCPDLRDHPKASPGWKYHPMWLYAAPGSGVWVNVGNTLVVASYDEAVRVLELLFPGDLGDYDSEYDESDACDISGRRRSRRASPPSDVPRSTGGATPESVDGMARTTPGARTAIGADGAPRRPTSRSELPRASNASSHRYLWIGPRRLNASEYLSARLANSGLQREYERAEANLARVPHLDSLQISDHLEYFSPLEHRHEVVLLSASECSPLSAPRTRPRVRCGDLAAPFPSLGRCPERTLRRLEKCYAGMRSPRGSRAYEHGLTYHGARAHFCNAGVGCYRRAGSETSYVCPRSAVGDELLAAGGGGVRHEA